MFLFASIKNQITNALKQVNGIGESKRNRKEVMGKKGFGNGTDKIHSTKTYQNYRSACVQFGEYLKSEHNIKNIYKTGDDLTRYTAAYVRQLKASGVSNGHIIIVESALMHLQRGMNKFNREVRHQTNEINLIKKRTITSQDKASVVTNRAFQSRDQAENMISKMSRSTQLAAQLSLHLGLRLKEACNIRVEHVDDKVNSMQIKIPRGSAITKGGRKRDIPIPKVFEPQLRAMIRNKEPGQRISSVSYETVRKSFSRACVKAGEDHDRGTHRLRHTYARERLKDLVNKIKGGQEVLHQMVQNKLSNKRMDAHISKTDLTLYNRVKGAIDQVHSELGHGRGRWELMRTYMI